MKHPNEDDQSLADRAVVLSQDLNRAVSELAARGYSVKLSFIESQSLGSSIATPHVMVDVTKTVASSRMLSR